MILLDGKKVANDRNLYLKDLIEKDIKVYHRPPSLAIILVGDNPASQSYVKGKGKACNLVGISHELFQLEETVSEKELSDLIEKLNQDDKVDGILLQLPIPKHLNEEKLIDLISKDKDADGFHVINQGYLYQKKATICPATPKGIMTLLKAYDIDVKGMDAVIIGRSNIVGFPIARLLMDAGATITVCHRQTKDLAAHTLRADIIIASAGKAELVKADMVKKGVIVVDVGVNRVDGKLVGDVDFEGVSQVASYISPVPRGVGPMTINALMENTYDLYLKHMQK
ncbi:MAG: bifunctional 5,10-methylene-tetrahydrofolate dehydrogenase/5,10-methylene-tetrahydrofolate cyclohydrolase [Tenericutes bacterium HGW-Tenericutes-3]|nr:MAG: bifunctional 5,10-methylene-tetrahydrofolate dehydrogenase/5,10-methylene-tetrahydrofolate cyclohydrolase [Tenericutes bacterium HGW-Tenericutes-3]